jgi:hypothetical protein
MQVNKINSNINFKENTLSREMKSQNAILMLRDPNASVKFQQSQDYARKADSVNANPLTALGYKLYRTFNIIRNTEGAETEDTKLNVVA